MNENAEIIGDIFKTNNLMNTILSMLPRNATKTDEKVEVKTIDQSVKETCESLLK